MSTNDPPRNARVRVYLPTYRRKHLLPRALASLQAQSLSDWTCEVHNDDPEDAFPADLVHRLADDRLACVTHPRNLGALQTFNTFYRAVPEPYVAILEDDNTWDPSFLQTLVAALEQNPAASLAWCNQRVFREDPQGTLSDTGKCVRPSEEHGAPVRLVRWGEQWEQVTGAVHANGSMVLRSASAAALQTPDISFAAVEAYRERFLEYPLLYVPQALATFTVTQMSARPSHDPLWGLTQVALASTFLSHGPVSTDAQRALWRYHAMKQPSMSNQLIAAGLVCPAARWVLRFAAVSDWARFLAAVARRPPEWWKILHLRRTRPGWWSQLDTATQARFGASASAFDQTAT